MRSLHKFTEQEARCFIIEQHAHYHNLLRYFAMQVGFKPNQLPELPSVRIVDSVYRYCGQYQPSSNSCEYSFPVCIFEGKQYAETVAHEVCHAIHPRLYGKSSAVHGSNFLWLLRDICKFPKATAKWHLTENDIANIRTVASELIEMRAAAGGGGANDIVLGARGSLKSMIAELQRRQERMK